ncbi:ABC transporter permease [Thermoflavimicrobium dichotomicum]|uniref:Peptide/nickel transport system permease protein n=1 Tax=Thermoflavimicrobium dichotomicum TaxID=46223 RepID=A0A1I3LPY1_9BACL|nr:ABC transporter permease [Thermoflavimicrobium dichotomicum]SFI86844.1 peptide/nickel transport system permease protein [Thermoflavimicrobium dichotomicum]
MGKYILRRLLGMIPVLFIISVLLFSLVQAVPGDAFTQQLNPHVDHKYIEEMREKFGLDKSPIEQYFIWLKNFMQGEFGISFKNKLPVSELISDRVGNTVFLAVITLIITYLLAIPIGIYSANRPYTLMDNTITTFSFIGLSLPTFFGALLAIYIFSFNLEWFPSSGTMTAGAGYTGFRLLLDKLHHVILPATTLAVLSVASYTRYIRSSVLEAKRQDYVRTAYAKGLPRKVVMRKHVLRNALMPLITFFGLDLGSLFAGAVLTETVFTWPGLGRLIFESTVNRDYPVMMACYMIIAISILLGNLIADILYSKADPRVRYD